MSALTARLLRLPAVERLRAAYERLAPRDQRALLALSAVLGLLVLRFAIWAPLADYASASVKREQEQRQLWAYLQRTEAQARALAGPARQDGDSGQSLLTRVSMTSQAAGAKPVRLQPEGSGGVSVWFENVEFNQLLVWLDRLQEQGIGIQQLSIDRQEVSGKVNARLLLQG